MEANGPLDPGSLPGGTGDRVELGAVEWLAAGRREDERVTVDCG